jgi:hypothetical protein
MYAQVYKIALSDVLVMSGGGMRGAYYLTTKSVPEIL